MEILFYLSRRIRRSFWSILAIAAVIAALSMFSCVYSDTLLQKQMEIEAAYNALSVDVVISNIQGTKTTQLNIPDYYGELFCSDRDESLSPWLKNVRMVSRLSYGAAPGQEILGITHLSAAAKLSEMQGTVITLLCEEDDTLWQSSEKKCLVSYGMFQTLTPEEDGTYSMELSLSAFSRDGNSVSEVFQVVGYYSGDATEIYIPWQTSTALLKTLNGYYTIDSIRATVSDNRQLAALREVLYHSFSQVDPTAGTTDTGHFAATILDETLNQTVSPLKQNLHLLELLHPVVSGVAILISFGVCFYAVLTRRRELTALRFLGIRKRSIHGMVLSEIALCILAGVGVLLFVHTPIPAATITEIILSAFGGAFLSCVQTMKYTGISSIREAD